MALYMMYNKSNRWHVLEDKKCSNDIMDTEDIAVYISDIINNAKEATDIYMWDMSLYFYDILHLLYINGFYAVPGNPPIKKMKSKEFKSLIRDDMCIYHFTIKKGKKTIRMINASNICKAYDFELLFQLLGISGKKRKQMTITSIAKKIWTDFGDNNFFLIRSYFRNAVTTKIPTGESLEDYIRPSYHGGFLYNRMKTITPVPDVTVFDINSLYPYVMANCPLPYGEPHYIAGKPEDHIIKDAKNGDIFFFVRIKATFSLKKGYIPTVRLSYTDKQRWCHERDWMHKSNIYYRGEFMKENDPIDLTLTCIDYFDFIEHYNAEVEYKDFIWFPTSTSFFKDYVNNFYKSKQQNKGVYKSVAKSLLNNLSGYMSRSTEFDNIDIEFTDDKENPIAITTRNSKSDNSYIYIGSAITSYARSIIIDLIQQNLSRWVYTDTDSLHLRGTDPIKGIRIGDGLGEMKIEHHFEKVSYYKKKIYIGIENNEAKITFAGLPEAARDKLRERIHQKMDHGEISEELSYRKAEEINIMFSDRNNEAVKNVYSELSTEDLTEKKIADTFNEAKTIDELFVRLWDCPITTYMKISDGNFGYENKKHYIYMKSEYNFL